MNVGELRAILADERIPDSAEVRVGAENLNEARYYHWGIADDARWYGHDGAFWVEGRHPTSPTVNVSTDVSNQ